MRKEFYKVGGDKAMLRGKGERGSDYEGKKKQVEDGKKGEEGKAQGKMDKDDK